jgi:hypothetical protein
LEAASHSPDISGRCDTSLAAGDSIAAIFSVFGVARQRQSLPWDLQFPRLPGGAAETRLNSSDYSRAYRGSSGFCRQFFPQFRGS